MVRLARRYPLRVNRIVTLDTIYRGVPDEFESKMDAAIREKTGLPGKLSLESHRVEFAAWELGTWSAALACEFSEQTEVGPDGNIRYRPQLAGWQSSFFSDVEEGRYFESAILQPALLLVARDLDIHRTRQFSASQQRTLCPLAQRIARERQKQMQEFRRNGPHVRVKWMPRASHYLFVDRSQEIAAEMLRFLRSTKALHR